MRLTPARLAFAVVARGGLLGPTLAQTPPSASAGAGASPAIGAVAGVVKRSQGEVLIERAGWRRRRHAA